MMQTKFFLTRFNQYFKKFATDLAFCQNYIHQKMLTIREQLHKVIDLANEFYHTQQRYYSQMMSAMQFCDLEVSRPLLTPKSA